MEPFDASASTICVGLKGLSQGQGKLCQLSVDHMFSVAKGAKYGVMECQHQFKDRRWNCSTVHDETVFGPILRIGTSVLMLIFRKSRYSSDSNHSTSVIKTTLSLQRAGKLRSFTRSPPLEWSIPSAVPAEMATCRRAVVPGVTGPRI